MKKDKATLAIYAIQDRADLSYPWYVHDHAFVLMQNGRVEKFLQLERQTRKKYDNELHKHLYDLLKDARLLNSDAFDLVFVDNVVGRAFISRQGNIRFEAPLTGTLKPFPEKGKAWWLDRAMEAYVVNHELAHVCSCLPFFGKFKENSLLVHFDGGASLSNFSAWIYKNEEIRWVENNWTLQYLSSLFNSNALSFAIIGAKMKDQNAVPGKLMGLASYGTYKPELEEWLKKHNYFAHIWNQPSLFFSQVQMDFGVSLPDFDPKNPFIQDIAACFQEIFTREFIYALKRLKEKTQTDYLYYAGGSALNIQTNSKIIKEKLFDDVFIPPCTNDSGLALGAASVLELLKYGHIQIHSPFLNNWGIETYEQEVSFSDIPVIARMLREEKVIGICNGFGEAGPRALGNRSIIALPSPRSLSKKVSMQHKGREWYRPVAPVMLEKNARYFTGTDDIHHLSRYMLLNFSIIDEKQKEIEGTIHVDGTARIQVLFQKEDNPFLYELLVHMEKKYSIKALINTSFNKKGEPIVHTIEDAIQSAKQMNLDAVVINGSLNILY